MADLGVAVADLGAAMAAARETPLARSAASVRVAAGGLNVHIGHTIAAPTTATATAADAAAGSPDRPSRVRVETLDPAAVRITGGSGLAVRVARADSVRTSASVTVGIDYTAVASAFGGDWAGRLHATVAPECALITPEAAGCRPSPVASRNDRRSGVVTAEVALPHTAATPGGAGDTPEVRRAGGPGGVIVMLVAGESSSEGDYTATSLRPSATWSGGGSDRRLQLVVPAAGAAVAGWPGAGGVVRVLVAVAGRADLGDQQPAVLDRGWLLLRPGVHRAPATRSCTDDGHPSTGDQCWRSDNATLSHVRAWRGADPDAAPPGPVASGTDDGTRVERLRDTTLSNGDNDGEYWKVTTTDGAQYFFGRNRLPGWTAGQPGDELGVVRAGATATTPASRATRRPSPRVVSAGVAVEPRLRRGHARQHHVLLVHPGDQQLRPQPDRHRGLARTCGQRRCRASTTAPTTGPAPTPPTPGRRRRGSCSAPPTGAGPTGCETHDAAHWPDVPWDRECTSARPVPGLYSPTFWTTKRLASVTTQVATGAQAWKDVDAVGADRTVARSPGTATQAKLMWLNTDHSDWPQRRRPGHHPAVGHVRPDRHSDVQPGQPPRR